MKDYKQLFGYAAILFGIGFVIRSFVPAYAYNGPNISLGSNPIEHFSGSGTVFSNTSGRDFIITDVSCNGDTVLNISSSNAWFCRAGASHSFSSGLRVSDGENVTASGYVLFLSGYYAH